MRDTPHQPIPSDISSQGQNEPPTSISLVDSTSEQSNILPDAVSEHLAEARAGSFLGKDGHSERSIASHNNTMMQRYYELFYACRDGYTCVDAQGRYLDANPAYCNMVGYSLDELRAMDNFFHITPPKWHQWEQEEIWNNRLLKRGYSGLYEKEYIHKNGTIFPIELDVYTHFKLSGEVDYVWGIIRDITSQKQAHQALIQSQWQLQSVLRAAPVAIGTVIDRVIQTVNEKLIDLTGYSQEELIGKDARLLYPTEEEYRYVGQVKYQLIEEHGTGSVDTRWKQKNGQIIEVRLTSTPIDVNDWSKGVTFTALDITEQKRYERQLKESENLLAESQRVAHVGSWCQDFKRNKRVWSDELVRIFGMSSTDEEPNPFEAIHSGDRERIEKDYRQAIHEKKRRFEAECRILQQSTNAERWVNFVCRHEYDDHLALTKTVGIIQDITSRKKAILRQEHLEDLLRHSQKMDAIGRLAGGVAHDFNNMLGAIMGNIDFAITKILPDDPIRPILLEAIKATNHASSLTKQLLIFSRKHPGVPMVITVKEHLKHVLTMMERVIGNAITVRFHCEDDVGEIKCDPHQFEQVIVNLIINARDAMPQGGNIDIAADTAAISDDEAKLLHPSLKAGNYVKLSVKDSGHGMDAKTQAHIFEPFFTTKESGRGTGLGLATVYSIVEHHSGVVTVESTVALGSCFSIYFPSVTDRTAEPMGMPFEFTSSSSKGKEAILVVDDEDILRKLIVKMLESLGYTVQEASSGKDALALAQTSSETIDLLLTDLKMPNMDGIELAQRVKEKLPHIKILFTSGYPSGTNLEATFPEDYRDAFLQKPFVLSTLATHVRRILDRK